MRLLKTFPRRIQNNYIIFLALVAGVASIVVISLLFIAWITPKQVQRDRETMRGVKEMRRAFLALRYPLDWKSRTEEEKRNSFERGLKRARDSSDNQRDVEEVNKIEDAWRRITPKEREANPSDVILMNELLDQLVAQNEEDIVEKTERGNHIRNIVAWSGLLFFALAWFV